MLFASCEEIYDFMCMEYFSNQEEIATIILCHARPGFLAERL